MVDESVLVLQGTLRELWANKTLRINLMIMMVEWSFSSFSFFVVPFYLAKVDGNMYLFSLCTAIAELLSVAICLIVTYYKCNLKRTLIVFCATSFFGALGIMLFDTLYEGKS